MERLYLVVKLFKGRGECLNDLNSFFSVSVVSKFTVQHSQNCCFILKTIPWYSPEKTHLFAVFLCVDQNNRVI